MLAKDASMFQSHSAMISRIQKTPIDKGIQLPMLEWCCIPWDQMESRVRKEIERLQVVKKSPAIHRWSGHTTMQIQIRLEVLWSKISPRVIASTGWMACAE